jgi:hypothetical protein
VTRRILVTLALVLTGCRSGGSGSGGMGVVGADGPKQAADQFMASIKAEDIQATSIIWGSAKGPARELIRDRTELEKRILIMQCNLSHDSYRIVSDLPSDGVRRNLKVELRKGALTATTSMVAIQGPNQRWFVENTELAPMRGFCSSSPAQPSR